MSATDNARGECEQLLHKMLRGIDERQLNSVVTYFTEDGHVERRGERAEGREGIHRLLSDRPQGLETRHHASNFVFDMDGESAASATCYLLLYRGLRDESGEVSWESGGLVDYNIDFNNLSGDWLIRGVRTKLIGAL